MKKYKDVKVSDYEIGLTKMLDKKIKEVRGFVTNNFGDPVFELTKIEFEDGTLLGCEGEHDCPYLVSWATEKDPEYCNEYTDDLLENIQKSDPDYEEDEE